MCGCHLQKKKKVAFLREKHLQIREGKWSCLIHAYPVSFPSLICSTKFSLLHFLSFNCAERECKRKGDREIWAISSAQNDCRSPRSFV